MSTGNKFRRGDIDIVRKIGQFSAPLMDQLEQCIKAALKIL